MVWGSYGRHPYATVNMCQWCVSYCVCRQHSFSGEPVPWGSKAGASCWIPLLPRVQRDVSQQVGSETLDWAVNILKEKGSRFKQIPVVLKIKPTEHRTQFMFGQLTSLCSLSSLYRTGCSGLASISGPGLRQFSHLQPWWGGANRHACRTNVMLRAKGHSQHPTIPAVLQSRCRCRWHPGTPSATGFPPGKLFHRRSTLSHLCFTQETLSFICRFEKKMRGEKKWGLTWFTLELSFAISQTSATHQVTTFSLAVPFFPDPVVDSAVVAPF